MAILPDHRPVFVCPSLVHRLTTNSSKQQQLCTWYMVIAWTLQQVHTWYIVNDKIITLLMLQNVYWYMNAHNYY